MTKIKTRKAESNGRKPKPAKNAPRRRLASAPADAGKAPRRRRAPPAKEREKAMTPRLRKVLAMFGQPELAKICGVSRAGVQQWIDLPARHALAVEKASGGKLTKEYLAPDFYPRLAE